MPYQELLILLPCHSLEDFPTYHEGDDAQSLLASWSALWHPELIASAGQMPQWRRIEDPPQEVAGRLIVVPTVCVSRLPTGFPQRVKDEGGCLIRKTLVREEIVATALAQLGGRSEKLDPELTADFLALGYCYLQINLLTRQMRYSSNLDETYFSSQIVAAATAAVAGDNETARDRLAACFNVLAEERDHYYPVDAFVLDLNMLAATTIGKELREELGRGTPMNLLLSAGLLDEMHVKEPATLVAIRERLEAGQLGLMGGEDAERRLPLVSLETIRADLARSRAAYDRHLGQHPLVFGRWRFGLTPMLPGVLHGMGFKGALHTTFEEGKVPDGTQFKIRWEGLDGSAIDAIARPPLDATKPLTYLQYAVKMGESMDSDHVATICLAHWPGQASPWLGDLQRISRYCNALGKFVTIDEYFEKTDVPAQLDRFELDRYRTPYLRQAVIRKQEDPISTSVRYWQRQAIAAATQTADTLATLITNDIGSASENRVTPADIREETADETLDATLQGQWTSARDRLAACLSGGASGGKGTLVLNPQNHVRRMGVDISSLAQLPSIGKPIYAAAESPTGKQAVVDVPGCGFVWVSPAKRPEREAKPLLLAEEGVLRNEFFEAVINPTTGALSAIHEYRSRGNRLSQQLALRMPGPKQKPGDTYRDPDETAVYSVMAADEVITTVATTAMGEIVARGRLLDLHGNRLAGFMQTYRIWRGSRVLEVEIELDPAEEPRADPWNSYYCCRFAWADETAELFRTVHMTRQPTSVKQFEAPHYIDIATDKHNTTIFTGGLPFHRRHEFRMLDSLLMTRGERERRFKIGIGVDVPHPLQEAVALMQPRMVVDGMAEPRSGATGWLLHVDARNIIATAWEPLVEGGRVAGYRARLLETVGRGVNATLSCFRPVRAAERVDASGAKIGDCDVADGKVKADIGAHEWVEVVARF